MRRYDHHRGARVSCAVPYFACRTRPLPRQRRLLGVGSAVISTFFRHFFPPFVSPFQRVELTTLMPSRVRGLLPGGTAPTVRPLVFHTLLFARCCVRWPEQVDVCRELPGARDGNCVTRPRRRRSPCVRFLRLLGSLSYHASEGLFWVVAVLVFRLCPQFCSNMRCDDIVVGCGESSLGSIDFCASNVEIFACTMFFSPFFYAWDVVIFKHRV